MKSKYICNFRQFLNGSYLKFFTDLISDAPVCVTDKVVIVGAFRNENLNIYCEVQADPPPR